MTPDPFAVLGLPPDSDDAAIRARYLELVRASPPDRDPERFAAVRAAYEKLRDSDARLGKQLFDYDAPASLDDLLKDTLCQTPRPRIPLTELLRPLPRP